MRIHSIKGLIDNRDISFNLFLEKQDQGTKVQNLDWHGQQ